MLVGSGPPSVTRTTTQANMENSGSGYLVRPQAKRPEDSMTRYVRYFERVTKANGWSDSLAAQIFPGLLEIGSTDLDDLSETTLGSFRALKEVLAPVEESFREASVQSFFVEFLMREDEKVRDFAKRCRLAVQDVYPGFAKSNKDLLARDRFVHGLPGSLKAVVLNGASKKWEDVVQSAMMAEGISETLEAGKDEWQKNQTEEKKWIKSSGVEKLARTCFKCKSPGHMVHDCPGREKQCAIEGGLPRPMVKMTVDGCEVEALVDTGASSSILPIRLFQPETLSWTNFKTASGKDLEVVGTRECQVKVFPWELQHLFFVGNVPHATIGMDFLAQHDSKLFARDGTLSVKGVPVNSFMGSAGANRGSMDGRADVQLRRVGKGGPYNHATEQTALTYLEGEAG